MEGFQVLAMRARSNLEWLQTNPIPGNAPLIPRVRIEVMALESRIKSAGQKVLSAASPEGQELLAIDERRRAALELRMVAFLGHRKMADA
jgi:hypothetical protein